MQSIDSAGVLRILQRIASVMNENRDLLIGLDQVVGDGDLGLTMSSGFGGAARDAEGFSEEDPGRFFMKAGMAINKHAPSTMGTIMATGFMRGGKAIAGRGVLSSADVADFFEAFLQGVMERGKAKPGEKTVVDAIQPAAMAARKSIGLHLAEALGAIRIAAEKGMEDSRNFVSQHGKAAVFREKTQGLIDPGCMAFCLMLRGFTEAVD